ncbi:MAG: hypothetical protein V7641_2437 [Blastocatellia bacterium]
MTTREIPREQWISFFDDFSKRHAGWIVSVEVMGSDLGAQEAATGLPLIGISADLKAGENRIEIIIGGRPDVDVTRIIETPKRVWWKPPQGVADEAVEIESADGTTLLRFHYVPPEEAERQLPEKTSEQ